MSRRSRNSPAVASCVRPDRSPTTTIATSASRAASTASAISASVPSWIPATRGVTTCVGIRRRKASTIVLRPASSSIDGQLFRQREPERIVAVAHLEQRLDVDDVAVVTDELACAVGDRADDGDRRRSSASGRTPSFSNSTIDRTASSRASRCRQHRRASRVAPSRVLHVRLLEQAEPDFMPQDPPRRSRRRAFRRRGRPPAPPERLSVRGRPRQLDVDAGAQRQGCRLAGVLGHR